MIRIVLPFYSGDRDRMLELVRYMKRLDGRIPFPCLLSFPEDTDFKDIKEEAESLFSEVECFSYISSKAEWPEGPNIAWQSTASHIYQIPDKLPWFWMESDVTPTNVGWYEHLDNEYHKAKKPFMGHIVYQTVGETDEHMNGVAVYPWNAVDYSNSAMLTREAPFDIALSNDCMIAVHPANNLIAHMPRFTGVTLSVRDYDVADQISRMGCVFHGCNDGSLGRILTGQELEHLNGTITKVVELEDLENGFDEGEANWQKEAVTLKKKGFDVISWKECQKDVPGFRDQTDWASGVFHLPHELGKCHLNAGITEDDDGQMWLVSRCWERFNVEKNHWRSEIHVYKIKNGKRLLIDSEPIVLDFGTPFQIQHEDPRVTFHDGHFFVSDCIWEKAKRQAKPRQAFSKFTKDWKLVDTQIPKIGNNVSGSLKSEKNWLWFQHGKGWKFVYSFSPHVVMSASNGMADRTEEPKIWKYGEIRGGTPPVLFDGEYYSFFHSSLPWKGKQRRYYSGCYAFEQHAPHRITRITEKPLFSGSEHDPRILLSQITHFPVGALFQMGAWIITAGINDEMVGWSKIPHGELIQRMTKV